MGDLIDTKDGWEERSRWILAPGNVFDSVEDLKKAQARDRTSLGLVQPMAKPIVRARKLADGDRDAWERQRDRAMKQKDLWGDRESILHDLTWCPVEYIASFTCKGGRCKGHKMSIRDWELDTLARGSAVQKGPVAAERDVRVKFDEIFDYTRRDPYLFLGNTQAHPQNFMVVGFFWPLRRRQPRLF